MYKFLQKNKKKLLAVFAVGLMIVFILPSTFQQQDVGNPVIGELANGDVELRAADFGRAQQEWSILSRISADGQLRGLPITFKLATPLEQQSVMMALQMGRQEIPTPKVILQIQEHPEMYLLLQEEARQMGIVPSQDQVETILRNQVAIERNITPQRAAELRQSIRNFLAVVEARDRAVSTVKVSEPLRRHAVAQEWQQIEVNVVEYKVSEFSDQVPAPTPQQIEEHYEKYKELDPNGAAARSNGGFGYRLPDSVKIQYLEVPINAVEEVVRQRRTPYQWDVEAAKYYAQNQSEFPAPPATQPTEAESAVTDFTLGGSTTRPAATPAGPTTKPFTDVKGEIVDRLVRQESQKLALAIQNQIQAMLAEDYRANAATITALTTDAAATESVVEAIAPVAGGATTQPTTAPSATAGNTFASHEYLQRIADAIERQFKVRPNVTSRGDTYLGVQDLAILPGIGNAFGERLPLAMLVMSRAEAFARDKSQPNLLSNYEPGPPLTDFAGNVYFFRIADAQASRPATLDEVRTRVEQDWRTAQAYELARQAAEKTLEAAKRTDLASAAQESNRNVVRTGKFRNSGGSTSVEGYTLPSAANGTFIQQAFNLLKNAAESESDQPVTIIALPEAQRVVVAELASVEPVWDEQSYAFFDLRTGQELAQVYEQMLSAEWFSFDKLKSRISYAPVDVDEPAGEPNQPPPPAPRPLF